MDGHMGWSNGMVHIEWVSWDGHMGWSHGMVTWDGSHEMVTWDGHILAYQFLFTQG